MMHVERTAHMQPWSAAATITTEFPCLALGVPCMWPLSVTAVC